MVVPIVAGSFEASDIASIQDCGKVAGRNVRSGMRHTTCVVGGGFVRDSGVRLPVVMFIESQTRPGPYFHHQLK